MHSSANDYDRTPAEIKSAKGQGGVLTVPSAVLGSAHGEGEKMIERRFLSATEVRSTGTNKIGGYAATFDNNAKLPGFEERLAPGCFTRAVSQDVVALVNHSPDKLLGRTTSGTLRLKQDSRGLAFECDLPNTTEARDAYELIKRGDLNGCSFGFFVNGDGGQKWSEERDGSGELDY